MTQLTNEIIKNNLYNYLFSLKSGLLLFGSIFFIVFIIFFVEFKTNNKKNSKKLILILVFLGIIMGYFIFKSSTINYSINNNSWYVDTDLIENIVTKKTSAKQDVASSHYIYLNKYGKVWVDRKTYIRILKGDLVYIVIAKGRFGETFATIPIYPTDEYIYKK